MERVLLIAITDFDRVPPDVLLGRTARIARAAEPGSVAIQLRDRSRSARALLAIGGRLREVTRAAGFELIVNDRLDLALELDADAIHLGEGSVATSDARRLWGNRAIYRACHDPEVVLALDADAVLLSPVLAARKGNPALGLRAVERARGAIERSGQRKRLFALGGVDATSAARCLSAGAHGVAAIGAAFDVEDPRPLLLALGIEREGTSP